MIPQQILHKLWVIEDSIVSGIHFDHQSLTLILSFQQDTLQSLEALYRTREQQIPQLGPNNNP